MLFEAVAMDFPFKVFQILVINLVITKFIIYTNATVLHVATI
jgi:hypothetical protein